MKTSRLDSYRYTQTHTHLMVSMAASNARQTVKWHLSIRCLPGEVFGERLARVPFAFNAFALGFSGTLAHEEGWYSCNSSSSKSVADRSSDNLFTTTSPHTHCRELKGLALVRARKSLSSIPNENVITLFDVVCAAVPVVPCTSPTPQTVRGRMLNCRTSRSASECREVGGVVRLEDEILLGSITCSINFARVCAAFGLQRVVEARAQYALLGMKLQQKRVVKVLDFVA